MSQVAFAKEKQYSPYEEVSISWSKDEGSFSLDTPWVSINVDVDADQRATIKDQTRGMPSEFLSNFSDYPVAYSVPRKIRGAAEQYKDSGAGISRALTPSQLAKLILDMEQAPELADHWSWDLDKVLTDSRLESGEGYDPLSVYSILRRLRLVTERNHEPNSRLFRLVEKLKSTDEQKFFELAALVVRQTYHVTGSCVPSLAPALQAYEPARALVQAFIDEETGHDLLVLQSLKAIGGEPSSIPILAGTRLSMELLRFSAERHFLAFSCAVGYFEGYGYHDEDPMARLLRTSSRPQGALGLQRHYLINKNGNHSAIGETFAATLGPVDEYSVIAATRLNELLSLAGNSMATDLVNKLETLV